MTPWAASLLVASSLLGHQLPDGVIDRGIQVVVFPDRVQVHYKIGLNDKMIRDALVEFAPEIELPEDPTAAVDLYRQHVFPRLPDKLLLTRDGEPLVLRPLKAKTLLGHHFRLECVYAASALAGLEARELKLRDENYADQAGFQRIALKGREGVRLDDSTAELVLIRVPLKPTWEMSPAELDAARQVVASYRLPPPSRMQLVNAEALPSEPNLGRSFETQEEAEPESEPAEPPAEEVAASAEEVPPAEAAPAATASEPVAHETAAEHAPATPVWPRWSIALAVLGGVLFTTLLIARSKT